MSELTRRKYKLAEARSYDANFHASQYHPVFPV